MRILFFVFLFVSSVVFSQEEGANLKPIDVNTENQTEPVLKNNIEDAKLHENGFEKESNKSDSSSSIDEKLKKTSSSDNDEKLDADLEKKQINNFDLSSDKNAFQQNTFSILADLAPLSMWIPYKMGGSLSWQFYSKWSLELTGVKGKIDLDSAGVDGVGDSSELRLDAVLRKQFGNSFQIYGGYSFQSVKAEASDEVKTNNPGLPYYDTTVKTQGLILGLGNRWIWGSGFTLGLDWVSVIFPFTKKVENDLRNIDISQYGSSQDKQDIEDAIEKIEKSPRLTILHIKIGWTF